MALLTGYRVAVLAADGFEESELTEPVRALQAAGAHVEILAPGKEPIRAVRHMTPTIRVRVDHAMPATNDAGPSPRTTSQDRPSPAWYDALLLPGGALSADKLRTNRRILDFVREIDRAGKPIAAICHAAWILVSAGVACGRTLTSYPSIQDDVRNGGGQWLDQDVVEDANWVTSRGPTDLPKFIPAMLDLFTKAPRRRLAA